MSKKLGFTFVEVLIVLAIVGILACVAFVLTRGVREKAKQAGCMSNFKQIYQAMMLYDAENPGAERVSRSIDLPLRPLQQPFLLMNYIKSHEVFYCPDTPECARQVMWSNYIWNAYPTGTTPWHQNGRAQIQERMERLGDSYQLVTCMAHDEVFYYPNERDFSEKLNKPYVLDLLANGAAKASRRSYGRTHDFARHCGQGAP